MRRLKRRANGSLRADGGAIAPLLPFLVLLLIILAAMVINVGLLYVERRELQNGADAAALAIATECAKVGPECTETSDLGLQYAGLNAADGESNVDEIDIVANSVKVTTSTSHGGSPFVPAALAEFLGASNKTVHADATAKWGAVAAARTLPLTFCTKEYADFVAAHPPVAPGTPGAAVLELAVKPGAGPGKGPVKDASPCDKNSSGLNAPGAFGWLPDETRDANCEALLKVGDTFLIGDSDPGASPPNDAACKALFDSDPTKNLYHQTVLIPIYDEVSGTGSSVEYGITKFAAFYVTGWELPGGVYPLSPKYKCKLAGMFCIAGYFVNAVDLDGEPSSAPCTTGACIVKLTD